MILGIDVGGTHTDAVLMEGREVLKKAKVVTDRKNLGGSLLEVAGLLLGETNARLSRAVLSTTISTNAIVENTASPVGLILTGSPVVSPELLPAKEHSRLVAGSVNHRGIVTEPVDSRDVAEAADHFCRKGLAHLGIVGTFSTRNPRQELEIESLAGSRFLHVSLGHRMSGNLNFPRRIATTYLNAAVWDTYRRFVETATDFFAGFEERFPVYILKADGGTLEISRSVESPVQTILSGPAASIMGILGLIDCREDAVALDIGGTTTDIALFADGVPLLEPQGVTIGGYRTLIRGLRMNSIGVGGDSVVRYEQGDFIIGPERRGPAAALGGPAPTPTDAAIVLGQAALGDKKRAEASLRAIADRAGCTLEEAARSILEKTCRRIADAVSAMTDAVNDQPVYTIHELLEGKTLTPRVLLAVGGPARVLAPRIGEMLQCPARIPDHFEIANAVGAALARTTAELTLIADTQKNTITIVEEGIQMTAPPGFQREDARKMCRERLRERARAMGGRPEDLDTEITEDQCFNMIRGFSTVGRLIRIKGQIKPGLSALPGEETGR